MITRSESSFELGEFSYDVALGKRRAGDIPLFNLIGQVQVPSGEMDSRKVSGADAASILLKDSVSKIQAVWRLNANPLTRVIAFLPADQFLKMADLPAFLKNGVLGVRFRKEQIGQSSPWIYGVTQYPVTRMENERYNILVEGYGLLFEASRRHHSRNFKTTTAQSVIGAIAKKYGLGFRVVGSLPDRPAREAEENTDDLAFLNWMVMILDAFWFLEENDLVLIGREYAYNQKPEVTLLVGRKPLENSETEFLVTRFSPVLSASSFEAGAMQITARGIDLDTGEVIGKVFRPKATRMGSLSLNSDQFLSDEGVTINGCVVRPSPKLQHSESGLFLPFRFRGGDDHRYAYWVEQKDVEVRAVVSAVGIPRLKPGMMVRVEGVGEVFGGNWIVEEVNHFVEEGKGFLTNLTLIRNALGAINAPAPFKVNLAKTAEKPFGSVRRFSEIIE